MKILGTSILARQAFIVRQFGSEAWRSFFDDITRTHPCFRAPVTALARLPLDAFLQFHEQLVRRFYSDDREAYVAIGQQSAQWALTAGPYRHLLPEPTVEALADLLPRLWRTYFTETPSTCEATYDGLSLDHKISNLPQSHVYFELTVAGYVRGALEHICANPIVMRRLPAQCEREYRYRFSFATAEAESAAAPSCHAVADLSEKLASKAAPTTPGGRRGPSKRELEVLGLVANGKTNKEIGVILGISARTVQNHVAAIYDKLGLYSRAGAVAWLLENTNQRRAA